MKLTSIKAWGFKSFADKIDIQIKHNITAIVGPNGSGKSNIVDAVRWVLGSQSLKSLRGVGSMTDCIFAGSKTREPSKRAEVSLEFDNTDHTLNSDLNEIEIKRVLYHTGENEYFINNTRVRLKDITDLFLDSGAGVESFNIISQGNIENVINSKPEERRTIIEEAAGVIKYKKRKEESLKKLDKTKENLEKVGLVIAELENSVFPLKEQSEKAEKYLKLKKELEELEISFMATDIKEKNEEYQILKSEVEELEKKVLEGHSKTTQNNSKTESLRLTNLKLEEEIGQKNAKLLKITEELAAKSSEKEITLERQKYSYEKDKINEGILNLKEEVLQFQKQEQILTIDVKNAEEDLKQTEQLLQQLEEDISLNRVKEKSVATGKNNLMREMWELKNKIDILENNLTNDSKLPIAVKNVLNNPRLEGIHGTIGKLITTDDHLLLAMETALGASTNFIVVENETHAQKSIQYLKENHLGRATFFPLNIIKGRKLEEKILIELKKEQGYLGVASDLVKYDSQYKNIIDNQLGNIIVVNNMDNMNRLGKKLSYKYRIVTLEGEILHTGGSLTGGTQKNTNSSLSDKLELEKSQSKYQTTKVKLDKVEQEWEQITKKLNHAYNNRLEIETQKVLKNEEWQQKKLQMEEIIRKKEEKQKELEGMANILENKLDKHLIKILEELSELEKENEILKKELLVLKNRKQDIMALILEQEKELRERNSAQNQIEQELKQKEIRLGKLDIFLNHLLTSLSANYNLTYEKAIQDYPLEIEYNTAKEQVNNLKRKIELLGSVNLGSIEEYERINGRYQFLMTQKEDLEQSSQNLHQVISEMDEIMKEKFATAFEQIKEEFQGVFKQLFKGGNGVLKLTNPNDLLTTGIEIIAEPPGKKLNNITLLSGGEKTLTAISLLFAILNVKPVPFCILDEVEAALDEANVDTFGAYLQSKKEKSEYLLITHKKRTMEYADTLYGITMQESGVSKIVSVELEKI
ncbi:MAG: AAA family ATPase [Bacilli bacterium]|nr:AAA family ATPase [Bacilli bacterium]